MSASWLTPRTLVLGVCSVVLVGGASPPTGMRAGPDCEPASIGLRPEMTNTVELAFFGRSLAQVFTATDSLIRSITVWRQPDPFVNVVPMQLFIGTISATDSLRPDPTSVLLNGPIVSLSGTSDVSRPVRFELDPPWALPGPGRYYFAVKENWCDGGFGLLADSTGSYSGGDVWEVTPWPGCVTLGNHSRSRDGIDLAFEIEFCDPPVSVETTSWGDIKSIYR
jgi:hypothetical protein